MFRLSGARYFQTAPHRVGATTVTSTLRMCSARVRGGAPTNVLSDDAIFSNAASPDFKSSPTVGSDNASPLPIVLASPVADTDDALRQPPGQSDSLSSAVPPSQQSRQFILQELAGMVLFTLLTIVSAFVVYPTPQALASIQPGNVGLAARIAVGDGFLFPCFWVTTLCFGVTIREACADAAAAVTRTGEPAVGGGIIGRVVGADDDVRHGPFIDSEAALFGARAAVVYIMVVFIRDLVGITYLYGASAVMFWVYILFRVIPVAARRWYPMGDTHRFMGFVRRVVLVGIPLTMLPRALFPAILRRWPPDDVTFLYPLLLSFVEYLMVSALYNNKVVDGYSDESLSIVARFSVALIESSRIGMLVVAANSPAGSFSGLINATITGLVSEALARNNLFSISWRWILYVRSLSGGAQTVSSEESGGPAPLPPRPRLNKMGRFKRVYLGVKVDTEYWGVFMLVFIKCVGWSFTGSTAAGMDHDTGELLDVLDCPWEVIGVVAIGELAGDLLAWLIGWYMRRYAPSELHVNVAVITPRHAGVVVMMWLNVGGFFLNGISTMGVLSDSLQVEKT